MELWPLCCDVHTIEFVDLAENKVNKVILATTQEKYTRANFAQVILFFIHCLHAFSSFIYKGMFNLQGTMTKFDMKAKLNFTNYP